MRLPVLATLVVLTLLSWGCGGGGGGSAQAPPRQPGGGNGGGGGNNPSSSDAFTYPLVSTDHYADGIHEYFRSHPRPEHNKLAIIARHLALADTQYAKIAGSQVAIVKPNTLTDTVILDTRLEISHPPPVTGVAQNQNLPLGAIQYHLKAAPYEYRDGEAYVDFAHRQIGGKVMEYGFVQEEILILETNFFPIVATLQARPAPGTTFCPNVSLKNLDQTPVVIKLRRFLEVADQDQIYGKKLDRVPAPFDSTRYLKPLDHPVDIYMPAMAAYNFKHGPVKTYSQPRIASLTVLATRAFYDTMLAQAKDNKPLAIHTGNWGCGVYGNNKRAIWAIQRIAFEAAYLLFRQTTGLSPQVAFHYDAYDPDGVVQANEAFNVFRSWPEKKTLDDYTRLIHGMTLADPSGWQAKP